MQKKLHIKWLDLQLITGVISDTSVAVVLTLWSMFPGITQVLSQFCLGNRLVEELNDLWDGCINFPREYLCC